jgi:hypothetical protein
MGMETGFANEDRSEQAPGKGNCNLRRRSIPCYIVCGGVINLLLRVNSEGEEDMIQMGCECDGGVTAYPKPLTGQAVPAHTQPPAPA